MNGRYLHSERLVALFCFAVLLFNPPLLSIFDRPVSYAGIPILYLYLFVAWAILIGLLAMIAEISFNDDTSSDEPVLPTLDRSDTIKPKRRGD